MESSEAFEHTRHIRQRYTLQPSRLRGQHFLVDDRPIQDALTAASVGPGDTVVEVGPGLGVLTRKLLATGARVIACELDPFFVHILRETFGGEKNLEIIESDVLKKPNKDIVSGSYKVVTNLPYNITSAFFRKFLTETPHPISITALIQKEVAERLAPPVRNAPTSLFTLLGELYAECKIVSRVSPSSFAPPPQVDSALVHLRLFSGTELMDKWGITRPQIEEVMAFASRFFQNPRKKMSGSYGKSAADRKELLEKSLKELEESPDSRPAVLSTAKWIALWKKVR